MKGRSWTAGTWPPSHPGAPPTPRSTGAERPGPAPWSPGRPRTPPWWRGTIRGVWPQHNEFYFLVSMKIENMQNIEYQIIVNDFEMVLMVKESLRGVTVTYTKMFILVLLCMFNLSCSYLIAAILPQYSVTSR